MELIDFRRPGSESEGRDGGSKIPTMAIVSAMYGFTDLLVSAVNAAVVDYEDACKQMDAVVDKQIETIRELAPPEVTKEVEDRIKADGVQVAPYHALMPEQQHSLQSTLASFILGKFLEREREREREAGGGGGSFEREHPCL